MSTVFEGRLHVHYGQAYVYASKDAGPGFEDALRGQQNGLCGAAIPGRLLLLTGLHTGYVGFSMEVRDVAPGLDDTWEEVVEVSFQAPAIANGELAVYEFLNRDIVCHIPLAPDGTYRARYCARGMAHGSEVDTIVEGGPVDFYSLVFWPAPLATDAILKQTSETAAYWHNFARSLSPLPHDT